MSCSVKLNFSRYLMSVFLSFWKLIWLTNIAHLLVAPSLETYTEKEIIFLLISVDSHTVWNELLFWQFSNFLDLLLSVAKSCLTLCHPMDCTRLLFPSLSSRVCADSFFLFVWFVLFFADSCPLNWWCHPTISFSVVPFSSCPQPLPTSGSFPLSQLFASGGQSVKSFSLSISPSYVYSGLISFRID